MEAGKIGVAVLASGRGTNLQALMDAAELGRLDARILCVFSDREEAGALDRARRHGVEALHLSPKAYPTREVYDAAVVQLLRARQVELICLAGYMRILTPTFLRAFPNRIMNIHPSLLPAFPGLHAQEQAVEHGVRYSGVTVHFVDEGVDTGPIIQQRVVPVVEDDTAETLAARILEQEHQIYPECVQLYAEGRLEVVGRKVCVKPTCGGSQGGAPVAVREGPRGNAS